jgi:hypothetical protein
VLLRQAVQKAAGDVGNVQKSIQTNGAYVASPIPQAVPSPPTININVPGLGGNRGVQGPPGISYTAPATQNAAQVWFPLLKSLALDRCIISQIILISSFRGFKQLTCPEKSNRHKNASEIPGMP